MTEQWQELKETITEMRDNDGTGTQQDVCKFLADYMDVLEKQMQQLCEDAISRQAVMDALCNDCELFRNGEQTCFTKCEEYHFLATLPPVTPQPKTGHWEWVPSDDNPKLGDWHCSECRCVVVECVYKNEKRGIPLYKYCPQCGIKMVEEQESEVKE